MSGLASVKVMYMSLGKNYGSIVTISGRKNVNIDCFNHICTKFWYGLRNIKKFLILSVGYLLNQNSLNTEK